MVGFFAGKAGEIYRVCHHIGRKERDGLRLDIVWYLKDRSNMNQHIITIRTLQNFGLYYIIFIVYKTYDHGHTLWQT